MKIEGLSISEFRDVVQKEWDSWKGKVITDWNSLRSTGSDILAAMVGGQNPFDIFGPLLPGESRVERVLVALTAFVSMPGELIIVRLGRFLGNFEGIARGILLSIAQRIVEKTVVTDDVLNQKVITGAEAIKFAAVSFAKFLREQGRSVKDTQTMFNAAAGAGRAAKKVSILNALRLGQVAGALRKLSPSLHGVYVRGVNLLFSAAQVFYLLALTFSTLAFLEFLWKNRNELTQDYLLSQTNPLKKKKGSYRYRASGTGRQ